MGVGIPIIPPALVWKSCTWCSVWLSVLWALGAYGKNMLAGRQAGGPHYGARGTWIPSPGTMAHLGSSPGLKLQGQGLTVLTEHLHPPGWSFHTTLAIKPVPMGLGLPRLPAITVTAEDYHGGLQLAVSVTCQLALCVPTSVENTSSGSAIPLPTIYPMGTSAKADLVL